MIKKHKDWVKAGKCFVCGRDREAEFATKYQYCLTHYIRWRLRRHKIFIRRAHYRSPNSRVANERRRKFPLILHYLRSRYLAVHSKTVEPFSNIREALFWVDDMWSTLHLHHSFILRRFALSRFVRFLFHLDYLASRGWPRSGGWVGSKSNIRTAADRKGKPNAHAKLERY